MQAGIVGDEYNNNLNIFFIQLTFFLLNPKVESINLQIHKFIDCRFTDSADSQILQMQIHSLQIHRFTDSKIHRFIESLNLQKIF